MLKVDAYDEYITSLGLSKQEGTVLIEFMQSLTLVGLEYKDLKAQEDGE